jgi:hypothetical protein
VPAGFVHVPLALNVWEYCDNGCVALFEESLPKELPFAFTAKTLNV